ncbi:RDD family protein [bacterium JGI 053]|nr:RDD family protein [bacterium JGI 053]
MDQQHPAQPSQTPNAPGYQPPAPAQQYAVAGAAGPDLVKRGIATFIDFVIIGVATGILSFVLGMVMGRFGLMAAAVVGAFAVLVRDVAFQGRSPGKTVMGLAVVNAQGGPITVQQSVMRNSTLAVGMLSNALGAVPFLGLILGPVVGLAALVLCAYEIFLVATNKPRLGDNFAGGTHVVFQGQPAIAL